MMDLSKKPLKCIANTKRSLNLNDGMQSVDVHDSTELHEEMQLWAKLTRSANKADQKYTQSGFISN